MKNLLKKAVSIFLIFVLFTNSYIYAVSYDAPFSSSSFSSKTSLNNEVLSPKSSFKNAGFIQMLIFAAVFMLIFFGSSLSQAQQKTITNNKTNITFTISSFTMNGDITIAFNDLRSILPPSHRNGLHFNYVKNSGYFIYLDNSLNWKNGDPGAELIYNLVNSEKKYQYMVSDTVTTEWVSNKTGNRSKSGGIFVKNYLSTPETNKNNQLINAAITIKRPGDFTRSYDVPLDPALHGQVVLAVSLDSLYTDSTLTMLKERPSVVFHELWENFYRVDSAYSYDIAHEKAIQKEKKLSDKTGGRKSVKPGQGRISSKGLVIKKKTVITGPAKTPKNNFIKPDKNPVKKSS